MENGNRNPAAPAMPPKGWSGKRLSRARRSATRHLRSERGGTLVETAFSIAILLILIIGIMEASLAVYSYHFISNAAREGARYAIVRGSSWSGSPWNTGACAVYSDSACTASSQNIQDYVKSLAFPGISTGNMTVTPSTYLTVGGSACASYSTCNAAGDVVQVRVTYTLPFSIPFVPKSSLTMSSTSAMVISQ